MSFDFAEPKTIVERILKLLMTAPNQFFYTDYIKSHIRAKPASITSTLSRLNKQGVIEHLPPQHVNDMRRGFRIVLHDRIQVVREFHYMWVPVAHNDRQKKRFRTKANYTEFQLKGIMTKPRDKTTAQATKELKAAVMKYRAQVLRRDAPNHLIDVHDARFVDVDGAAEYWVKETEKVPPSVAPERQIALWHDADKFKSNQGLVVIYEP